MQMQQKNTLPNSQEPVQNETSLNVTDFEISQEPSQLSYINLEEQRRDSSVGELEIYMC
jgi:hypothetical protein